MRIFKSNRTGHSKAQSMVEFALVLPILLMIVYGLLEVGRLIFIYSTVVSASREAARYGSATGLNDTLTTYRYIDCAGIRTAADSVDFLGVIDPATGVTIQYDGGPGTSLKSSVCPPANPSSIVSGDRIRITVSTTFTPLAAIVPLNPTITSSSARTIIGSVQINP